MEKRLEILLVEDNPATIFLMKEIIEECNFQLNLNIVMNGIDALSYLKIEGQYSKKSSPDIIILDLNLPKMSGHELLERIKNKDDLKVIPVIILTTSDFSEDIILSYELHVNCYIKKPTDMEYYIKVIKSLLEFWCNCVELPKGEQN